MTTDIASLREQLASEDDAVRETAAEQLAHMGEDAREACAALVKATGDDSDGVKEWAAAALEGIGAPADGDLAEIAELLKSESADVPYWAATLLGRAGERAATHVGALAGALRDHWAGEVRQRVAVSFGKLGPAAAPARSALEAATQSPDKRLSRVAQEALEKIGER